jgi:hypothetical protein
VLAEDSGHAEALHFSKERRGWPVFLFSLFLNCIFEVLSRFPKKDGSLFFNCLFSYKLGDCLSTIMSYFLSIKSSISAILLSAFLFFSFLCLSKIIELYHFCLLCFLCFTVFH